MTRTELTPDQLDQLVKRVQDGDKLAFTEILQDLERELRIFISARSCSVDMTEEILQSAFVTCYQHIREYKLRGTFASWLKGIALNLLRKELREQARVTALEGRTLDALIARETLKAAEVEVLESGTDRLTACLEKLAPHAREIVQKRYGGGATVKSIAAALGRTETSVSVALFRIRERLKDCMDGKEALT
jgi:RNA polymerase sigma-70 factor (ECF subfamily)